MAELFDNLKISKSPTLLSATASNLTVMATTIMHLKAPFTKAQNMSISKSNTWLGAIIRPSSTNHRQWRDRHFITAPRTQQLLTWLVSRPQTHNKWKTLEVALSNNTNRNSPLPVTSTFLCVTKEEEIQLPLDPNPTIEIPAILPRIQAT